MKKIEMRGDEIINSAIKDLFSGDFETIDVIKLKDIYKDMEVALDSCYAVSDEKASVTFTLIPFQKTYFFSLPSFTVFSFSFVFLQFEYGRPMILIMLGVF